MEFLIFIVLVIIHELGHILCAYFLNLKILKIGIKFDYIPFPYVAIKDLPNYRAKYLFFLSGPLVTLLIYVLYFYSQGEFINAKFFTPIIIHFFLEINPMYSDYTNIYKKLDYYKNLKYSELSVPEKIAAELKEGKFIFSKKWMVHVIIFFAILFTVLAKINI